MLKLFLLLLTVSTFGVGSAWAQSGDQDQTNQYVSETVAAASKKPASQSDLLDIYIHQDNIDEETASSEPEDLYITGISDELTLGTNDLVIGYTSGDPISLKRSQIDITDENGRNMKVITELFTYDPGCNVAIARQQSITDFINQQSAGTYYLSINFVSEDYMRANNFSFPFIIN